MRQLINLNRSGLANQAAPVPTEPFVMEIEQQPSAASTYLEANIVALKDHQLQIVSFDQLQTCQPGSVFVLLCRSSSAGTTVNNEVFFISQLLGASKEFSKGGWTNRTIYIRTIRRPGQLGPYGHLDRVDALNVRLPRYTSSDEIYFLPTPRSFFTDLTASTMRFSKSEMSSMNLVTYSIMDDDGGAAVESYKVHNSPLAPATQLSIGSSNPITGEFIYCPLIFNHNTPSDKSVAYVNAPVLGLNALATLKESAASATSKSYLLWSCLHRPKGSSILEGQFIATDSSTDKIMASVAAAEEGDTIVNFSECTYQLA